MTLADQIAECCERYKGDLLISVALTDEQWQQIIATLRQSGDTLLSALRNCQGWADGIASTSKDNASREVASWIRDKCMVALSAAEVEERHD